MAGNIYIENYEGKHNTSERYSSWGDLGLYKDLSTVWVTPTRGTCGTRVAFSWMNVMGAPNSAVAKLCVEGFEVGKAYNEAIVSILKTPSLAKFKYLLTVEEDNTPPPDGLLKLYKAIQNFDVVGGLYWLKGEDGAPMIWGDPKSDGFQPQAVIENTVQECNGLGMGFTLFRMDLFKDSRFEFGQWFKTIGANNEMMTQDLWFFNNAKKLGYRFACDTSVKVGHYDSASGVIW